MVDFGEARFGFGFVECGSVTPRPQDGNPKPRLFRLVALGTRAEFRGRGLEAVMFAETLKRVHFELGGKNPVVVFADAERLERLRQCADLDPAMKIVDVRLPEAPPGITPWAEVSWQAAAWLVPIGVLALLGQWCMTRALSRGAALLVVNLQYVGIVFGSLYGLLLFGDRIELTSWAGIVLIVASGIAATVLRMRVLPDTSVEDH